MSEGDKHDIATFGKDMSEGDKHDIATFGKDTYVWGR